MSRNTIAAYLDAVMEYDDPTLMPVALEDIESSRTMNKLKSRQTGLSSETK